MKRYIQYTLIAIVTLVATSCTWSEGQDRSSKWLGQALWNIAYPDLVRVNEIFEYVAHYNYMLTIDDEQEYNAYKDLHFRDSDISIKGNIHTITHNTAYGTNYSTTIEMNSDHWHVVRSGGNGYDLTIHDGGNDCYSAVFSSINYQESQGCATFNVNLTYTEGVPSISYTGELTMVDRMESCDKPLTVTTRITEPLSFVIVSIFKSGVINITAHDALYDSTDEARVIILHNSVNQIIIECLGEARGYNF